jgi:pyridinium-3,5-bisthiocarboxylic acid mononucleotide nickel chelatase
VARIAYFDCFSGVSGDMVLGALLDLGLPLEGLRNALGSLAIDYGAVAADRVLRAGVSATKFRVHQHAAAGAHRDHQHDQRGAHAHRDDHSQHHTLAQIAAAIDRSALPADGKARAKRLFQRLGEAEAAIHQLPLERVHLHEVGAIDSIIDIVGVVHGMEWLAAGKVIVSPLNVGGGTVECTHGTFPVPAPATARLLQNVPIYGGAPATELVTPSGALLVTEYATEFAALPPLRIHSIGYGAGDKDFPRHPNVLRVVVGDAEAAAATEEIVVLECEIDDMNPQLFGPLMDRLHGSGALDVLYAPVQMKKNRPGTLVTVVARPEDRQRLTGILFAETTTIGVRYRDMRRERLEREVRTIATPLGPMRVKIATREGTVLNVSPEFEDCARAAADHRLPIKEVQAIVTKAWLDTQS